MDNRVIIIAGGQLDPVELGMIRENDVVITADAGAIPLMEKGMTLHVAVGDFDTIDRRYLEKMQEQGISIKKLSIHKQETDTHHALQVALEYRPREIIILGALGGSRLDHMMGNVGLLEWVSEKDVSVILMHKSNRMRLLQGPVTWNISRSVFPYISLIPITEEVIGVTTTGLRYALNSETLHRGLTRGISNELMGKVATVHIERGKCLGIESKDL